MFFKQFNLGPLEFRLGCGDGWTQLDFGLITDKQAGLASRETSGRLGFKSEHLTDMIGKPNPNDVYITPEGERVYGKIVSLPGGGIHILSAHQVYAKQLKAAAFKAAGDQVVAEVQAIPAAA
jgi:hypothetical protein